MSGTSPFSTPQKLSPRRQLSPRPERPDILNRVLNKSKQEVDELKQALADSVEDYLELCAEVGKEPEKPFSGRFNLRISPALHQQIAKKAADAGVSINYWISDTLAHAIQ